MSQSIKTITDGSFETDVLQASAPVLIDFWAPWCGPCRALAPVFEEVAGELSNQVTFGKINIDENSQTPATYGVMSIPTIMLFKNGEVAAVKMGLLSKSQLSAFIEEHI